MAEIQASVNGVSTKINPNRPSWDSMYKNYPGEEVTSDQFYPMVSKAWERAVQMDRDNWENTCATRMSYALNRSGIKLQKAPGTGNLIGDDKFNYWIRVKDLKIFLNNRFKGGDVECELPLVKDDQEQGLDNRVEIAREKMLDLIAGKNGIVVFDVVGWGNATGHFTLWGGEDLIYVGGEETEHNNPESFNYYFWYTNFYDNGKIAQTKKITFWELK